MDWKPLITTFICILFGFSLALFFQPKAVKRCEGHGKHKRHSGKTHSKRFLDRFAKKYDLDKTQMEKVKHIFSNRRQKIKELKKEISPRFKEIKEQGDRELRLLIPEDKKALFDEHQKKIAAKRNKIKERRREKRKARDTF